jgi:uncharacterized protein
VATEGRNPFEFGRELDDTELVDRESELTVIERAITNRGKLFLIGPRRHGKTSILSAVENRLARKGAIVLRFDAEAYESLDLLAQALLGAAAAKFAGTVEKATKAVARFFGALKPEVSYDLAAQKLKVSIAKAESTAEGELPTLTQVLSGINAMAKGSSQPVAVILDEFQHIVLEGGIPAERQLRAEIQTHGNVAYIFAGSKTRLLADMTGDPARAFWKLGERYFLGPVPRADFIAFLRRGFEGAGHHIEGDALERLIDVAEDVPYNVQRLAYVAWELLRTDRRAPLTTDVVQRALTTLVRQEHPAYAQLWASLTRTQKTVLKAVILERGAGLTSNELLKRYGIGSSTMHKTLRLLDEKGLIREDEREGVTYKLEDPFLGAWLKEAQGL